MSKEGNIDDIFKDKLSELEVAPSDALWGRIENDLNNKPGRKKFWIFALMFLLVSSMAIGGLIYEKPHKSVIEMAEAKTGMNDIATNETDTQAKNETEAIASASNNDKTPTQTSTQQTNKTSKIDTNEQGNNKLNQQTIENNRDPEIKISNAKSNEGSSSYLNTNAVSSASVGDSTSTQNSQIHSIGEANQLGETPTMAFPSIVKSGFEPDFIHSLSSEFPRISPFFNSKKRMNENSISKRQWMVGVYIGVNYNLKHLSYDSQAQLMVVDSVLSKESNTTTFTYGASASLKWKKHWRITTGVSYSKWCRKATYPLNLQLETSINTGSPNGEYAANVGGSTGEQNVNVPIEKIEEYDGMSPIPTVLEFDLQVHECYEIVSIPMRLGYEVFFNEFSVIPEIGFGYNHVVGNNLEVNASNELDPIDFERQGAFNKNMFSFSGSLGIERYLNPHFKIGVNGVYDYAITPLYKSNQFSTHPYTLSGQVRLWYIFSK